MTSIVPVAVGRMATASGCWWSVDGVIMMGAFLGLAAATLVPTRKGRSQVNLPRLSQFRNRIGK